MNDKEFIELFEKEWKKLESSLPTKKNAYGSDYAPIRTTRVVFSEDKVLDIEDIAGNNIRLIEKEEAEWLIKQLKIYLEEFANPKLVAPNGEKE